MKPKYKVGDKVRIKSCSVCVKGGCIGKVITIKRINISGPWPIIALENYVNIHEPCYDESELKPYCPTRAGKRGADGKFVSKNLGEIQCICCGNKFNTQNDFDFHSCISKSFDKLSHNDSVKKSQTLAGQREMLRRHNNLLNQLEQRVNELEIKLENNFEYQVRKNMNKG